ncbi:MAG TPA: hypothetical protein VN702_13155 [Acetobacteraceae bacterium]|nr:hypothetical protein [Acetobacteraceae bacterium]
MAGSRKAEHPGRAIAIPVMWILVLLVSYWLMSDWQALPRLLSSAIGAIQ